MFRLLLAVNSYLVLQMPLGSKKLLDTALQRADANLQLFLSMFSRRKAEITSEMEAAEH